MARMSFIIGVCAKYCRPSLAIQSAPVFDAWK
jgi:hypothetical protein